MKLLAIETSTEACSAAISINDACAYRYELAPRKHSKLKGSIRLLVQA